MTNAIPPKSYALVSACRNEENYLDGLAACIAAQTLKPVRWIIVDDGSTDATFQRASSFAARLPFVTVVRMPPKGQRSFASQVYAAQHGYKLLQGDSFHYIGFLDADIQMPPDYYEKLVARLDEDPKLGLCGGALWDRTASGDTYVRQGSEDYHVPGGIQLFRRACFDQFGGYLPIPGGGQDTVADIMCLMHGWKLTVFTDIRALHLRPDGFSKLSPLRQGLNWGRKFYLLGYHPIYFLAQSFRRAFRRPILIGGCSQLLGFVLAAASRPQRPVSSEFVGFLRRLQMTRLRRALLSR
jgi:biofilm PGA synthesis N-glycosyltransferase PgaC